MLLLIGDNKQILTQQISKDQDSHSDKSNKDQTAQTLADDFTAAMAAATWVRYWETTTASTAANYDVTKTK
ncbi:unnamed protein product [Colias eurytheme]|nr:unnamed protein product [Colias eurytheme]